MNNSAHLMARTIKYDFETFCKRKLLPNFRSSMCFMKEDDENIRAAHWP